MDIERKYCHILTLWLLTCSCTPFILYIALILSLGRQAQGSIRVQNLTQRPRFLCLLSHLWGMDLAIFSVANCKLKDTFLSQHSQHMRYEVINHKFTTWWKKSHLGKKINKHMDLLVGSNDHISLPRVIKFIYLL